MLNPFPELLVYSLLAPFILRLVAGYVFINLGILSFRSERGQWINSLRILRVPNPHIGVRVVGIIEMIGGALLIIGLWTQITAIVLAVLTFAEAYLEYRDPTILKRNIVFYVLLLGILLSLTLSSAGAFAIDLPL